MQTRPEGRLFLGPPSQAVSEIHPHSVPRQDVPIHVSSIRADIGPTHLHQNTQTSNRDSKKDGYPDNSLSGRYAHYEQHLRGCQKRNHDSEINSTKFRISDQRGEIHICSCTDYEFLGIIVDSTTMRFLLPGEKVAVIQKESRHLVSSQVASLSQLSHINRKVNFLQNCSSSSPPSVSGDPTFEEQQHPPPR